MSSYTPQFLGGLKASIQKQTAKNTQSMMTKTFIPAIQQAIAAQQATQQLSTPPIQQTSSGSVTESSSWMTGNRQIPSIDSTLARTAGQIGAQEQGKVPWLLIGLGAAVLYYVVMKKKSSPAVVPVPEVKV